MKPYEAIQFLREIEKDLGKGKAMFPAAGLNAAVEALQTELEEAAIAALKRVPMEHNTLPTLAKVVQIVKSEGMRIRQIEAEEERRKPLARYNNDTPDITKIPAMTEKSKAMITMLHMIVSDPEDPAKKKQKMANLREGFKMLASVYGDDWAITGTHVMRSLGE